MNIVDNIKNGISSLFGKDITTMYCIELSDILRALSF
jgi:hypothetical protein